jgi:ring-1,2-phenylacetyl-CoA epoxidase subunit PaaC
MASLTPIDLPAGVTGEGAFDAPVDKEGHGSALFDYVLRLGDDALILGQRLSEWCGHAPSVEVDLSLANMALDLVGQATHFLHYAGQIEGEGRDGDKLAFHRDVLDFRNCLLVEQPNGDFAQTMARQFLYSTWQKMLFDHLAASTDELIASVAAKAVKEVAYHIRHAGEWVIRLGDGTEESARRMREAVAMLAYVGELFEADAISNTMADAGIAPNPTTLRDPFDRRIEAIFVEAGIEAEQAPYAQSGGRQGRHGEAMGYLLAELQYMQRTYPGAVW